MARKKIILSVSLVSYTRVTENFTLKDLITGK